MSWAEDSERHEGQGVFGDPCGVQDCSVCADPLEPQERPQRVGYQVSVDIEAHKANMAEHKAPAPVIVLIEVLADEQEGQLRRVHQVRFTGPARTEYGWSADRAHARGRRFGAAIWIYTESPVEYLDEHGDWHVAP